MAKAPKNPALAGMDDDLPGAITEADRALDAAFEAKLAAFRQGVLSFEEARTDLHAELRAIESGMQLLGTVMEKLGPLVKSMLAKSKAPVAGGATGGIDLGGILGMVSGAGLQLSQLQNLLRA